MALTGKAIEVNAALRAAAGAVKMMSLSEGVECPYVIDGAQFKGQCKPDINLKILEDTRDQYKRSYVFLRAVQQGVTPPINISALPEEEEKALINDLRTTINEFKSSIPKEIYDIWLEHGGFETDLYNSSTLAKTSYTNAEDLKKKISKLNQINICKRFLRINPENFSNIEQAFAAFISGDQGNGLRAYDCKKRVYVAESNLTRFLGYFRFSPSYLEYQIQDFIYAYLKNRPLTGMLASTAPTNLNDINILLVDKYKLRLNNELETDSNRNPIPGTKRGIGMYDNKSKDNLIGIQYTEALYITVNDNIKLYSSDTPVTDIVNQQSLRDVFIKNAAMDVHPYVMYLLQMDPWASKTFMADSFGGNMTPQQYPLAFYIVAHFMANQPQYEKNPADFYRKPIADKKLEMLAAIKANEPAVDTLLRDGYAWLGEKYPGMGNIRQMLGDTRTALAVRRATQMVDSFKSGVGRLGRMFTRKQKGGARRITRKASTLQ